MSEENQNVFDKSNSDTIEKNFEKLDEIISKIQSGEISLGEALEAYKEGTLLVEDTAKRLDMIEKQITFINE